MKIYRKHNYKHNWSQIVLKCVAQLDHIPKHIVIKAISDISLRAKWDNTFGDIEVLEHNKERDQTFYRYKLRTPHHLQNREAVILKKILRDFPDIHHSAIVQRSADHPRCPENHRNSVRVDMRMNGFILDEDTSLRGTKLTWVLSNDLLGSLTNQQLAQMHLNY